jgi:S-adenosyl-L-methionine hydrolase (adenosine-forming)
VQPIICFTSDFGLEDTWVGVCHAVVHQRCPTAHIVDLSHGVAPYDVRAAAAVAAAGVFQLPGSIHMVVVDPGVGGARKDLCIRTSNGTHLLGPDNGVLLPAASRAGGIDVAVSIEPARYVAGGPAATFHARDVFAPAAAELACGGDARELGVEVAVDSLAPPPFAQCTIDGDYVLGEILDEDRYGSLRTSIPSERLDELGLRAEQLEIVLGHDALTVPFGRTFSDVADGAPVALVDASGWLTLAVNQASAADRYGAVPGASVRVRAE